MGHTHVLAAATAALAVAPVVPGTAATPVDLAGFAVVAAGYGILPDLDHPQATLAHILGPVTKTIAAAVAVVSGGHRKGTHTLWAAAGAYVAVSYGTSLPDRPVADWVAYGIVFVAAYLTVMVLRAAPHPGSGAAEATYLAEAAAATACFAWFTAAGTVWMPWAVAVGVGAHIAADMLTVEGVPVFWPLSNYHLRIPVLGGTDSGREHVFAWLLVPTVLLLAVAAFTTIDPTALLG